jgi:hypothetical protein
MRGIKPGWYAMDRDGNLVSGPFSSREKCVEGNYHATNGINAVRSVLTTNEDVSTSNRSALRAASVGPTTTAPEE